MPHTLTDAFTIVRSTAMQAHGLAKQVRRAAMLREIVRLIGKVQPTEDEANMLKLLINAQTVKKLALLFALVFSVQIVHADVRHASVRTAFLKAHGLAKTPRGAQCDHWRPLQCQGADSLENLRLIYGPKMQQKERREQLIRRRLMTCEDFAWWLATQDCTPDWCAR